MEEKQTAAEPQHKRRVRYSGKYPRHFTEKYKELHPEKYAATVAKVIAKGSTPAGMHIPILVPEILSVLQIRPGMRGFDATLGYGGHTRKMLEKLQGQGHLFAGDIDPIESVKTKQRLVQMTVTLPRRMAKDNGGKTMIRKNYMLNAILILQVGKTLEQFTVNGIGGMEPAFQVRLTN